MVKMVNLSDFILSFNHWSDEKQKIIDTTRKKKKINCVYYLLFFTIENGLHYFAIKVIALYL